MSMAELYKVHFNEVLPLWLAALGAMVCHAQGVPPTPKNIETALEEAHACAWRNFICEITANEIQAKANTDQKRRSNND